MCPHCESWDWVVELGMNLLGISETQDPCRCLDCGHWFNKYNLVPVRLFDTRATDGTPVLMVQSADYNGYMHVDYI